MIKKIKREHFNSYHWHTMRDSFKKSNVIKSFSLPKLALLFVFLRVAALKQPRKTTTPRDNDVKRQWLVIGDIHS